MTSLDILREPSLVAVTGKRHGLGNRVRVVLGARSLARLEGRRFFYTWHTGREFGGRFDDLWEVDDTVVARLTTRVLARRYPLRDEKLTWIDQKARLERVWQIKTPHALHLPDEAKPWEAELQAMNPVEPIRARVHEFFEAHLRGEPYIGVMVRAHPNSHAVTLAESPVSWYLERMRQLRQRHPNIRFFVSADTAEAQAFVIDAIPGSFGLSEKGRYNSRDGLRSSVADLYLLAGSAHVLAPHYSSFPELAQKLAGPGLALETSHTEPAMVELAESALSLVGDPTSPHIRRTV